MGNNDDVPRPRRTWRCLCMLPCSHIAPQSPPFYSIKKGTKIPPPRKFSGRAILRAALHNRMQHLAVQHRVFSMVMLYELEFMSLSPNLVQSILTSPRSRFFPNNCTIAPFCRTYYRESLNFCALHKSLFNCAGAVFALPIPLTVDMQFLSAAAPVHDGTRLIPGAAAQGSLNVRQNPSQKVKVHLCTLNYMSWSLKRQ